MSSIRQGKRSEQSGGAATATAATTETMTRMMMRPTATTKSTIAAGVANSTVQLSGVSSSTARAAAAPVQQQTNGQPKGANLPTATTTTTGNKLVFGLSSRTNKLRHDEYATERRGAAATTKKDPQQEQQLQQQHQQQQVNLIKGTVETDIRLGTGKSLHALAANQKASDRGENGAGSTSNRREGSGATVAAGVVGGREVDIDTLVGGGSGSVGKTSSIRASKYGNFYKPQDLVTKPTTVDSILTARPTRSPQRDSSPSTTLSVTSRSKSPGRPIKAKIPSQKQQQQSTKTTTRRSSPTRQKASAESFKQQVQIISSLPATIANNSKPTNQTPIPPVSKSAAMKERGENSPSAPTTAATNQDALKTGSNGETTAAPKLNKMVELEGAQSLQPKMQFNIPPPPQVSSSGGNNKPGGSAVSYAKSRIYDRPTITRQHKQQILLGESSSSLLDSGTIPESILFGFKPPKQVNVSKAREKWEGGEPFAKCKSRQRLASAQASNMKKLLHGFGYWSTNSSMVAMQQMQLQQAMGMSQSNSGGGGLQQQNNDSPVKILTRGSVLERVQQFEKSPQGSSSSSGTSSGSSSSSGSESSSGSSSPASESPSTGSGLFESHGSDSPSLRPSVVAATPASIAARPGPDHVNLCQLQATTEAGLALQQPMEPAELRSGSLATTAANASQSKQAIYKTRVSSIQTQTPHATDPLTMLATNGPKSPTKTPGSPTLSPSKGGIGGTGTGSGSQRRPSLRRRSSSSSSLGGPGGGGSSNSSSSSIPKFYHPYGKPNTYEIELQKKNIVSCFDKFPDRKALISGPTCRRHFQAIALACGFTEYFKEPLMLYVKHQMTNSNLLHSSSGGSSTIAAASASIRQHRQSGIGAAMLNLNSSNNINEAKQASSATNHHHRHQLTRAASIDNSTMERLHKQNFVTCEQFLTCWRQMISTAFDNHARFVYLLTLGKRNYLIPDDFVPLIQSIIDDHPGLKFLRSAPDFHMRYIQTVIARIYYCINKSWTGKLSLTELRQSNLLAVMEILSHEEDINQITDYFSYEHFYVIYCKFWNLDKDHDLLISKEDLAKHNDAAISSRIIDRIFMGIVSRQIQKTGMMSYSDFVWFLLAEEDKKHPRSIEYWFRLLDLDGDGYISMYEMEYFYYEQMKRLELMNIEALPFIDSACQILDLVNPREKNKISLADLKRTKMATIFFDTFINLEKYLEHESREFVSTRDHVQDGVVISDWDRYASEEYESLVTEESSV